MQEEDDSIYAPALKDQTGGMIRAGGFGEDRLSFGEQAPQKIFAWASQMSPNVLIYGAIAVTGIFGISSLMKASPNSTMLEYQQVQAETNKQVMVATTEALKSAVNQPARCVAIVCINQPEEQEPIVQQPVIEEPWQEPSPPGQGSEPYPDPAQQVSWDPTVERYYQALIWETVNNPVKFNRTAWNWKGHVEGQSTHAMAIALRKVFEQKPEVKPY